MSKHKKIILYQSELNGLTRFEMGEVLWNLLTFLDGDPDTCDFAEPNAAVSFGAIKKRIIDEDKEDK